MNNKYKKFIKDKLNIYENVTQCLVCSSNYLDLKTVTYKCYLF